MAALLLIQLKDLLDRHNEALLEVVAEAFRPLTVHTTALAALTTCENMSAADTFGPRQAPSLTLTPGHFLLHYSKKEIAGRELGSASILQEPQLDALYKDGEEVALTDTLRRITGWLWAGDSRMAATSQLPRQLLHTACDSGRPIDPWLNLSYMEPTTWKDLPRDFFLKGQTALHIAIERKLENIVQHLVKDGADLDIEADGQFFQIQKDRNDWFYFGGYPLSLAACTKQQAIVQFLICNKFKCANIYNKDHLGNTVLHALILSANDSQEHCDDLMIIYNKILNESVKKMQKDSTLKALETIKNNEGLTPLQLAAKNGKVKILKHILQRNFDEDGSGMKQLSRRILEWNYGPIFCYLYDLSEVDTVEKNSVLEIAVYGKTHNDDESGSQ
ncbi:transient receptor potential cation channel subfamily V member 1-like [Bombina bombina]|uniref:transient receptor potential cation channel subfamily V member 1-like n=1 Tax=Bombina bombina TaxID=8345 RepID=UPI00235A50DF|nr:transient receptor potential cation channel subfamily V member 1-like [Bombina bombina]